VFWLLDRILDYHEQRQNGTLNRLGLINDGSALENPSSTVYAEIENVGLYQIALSNGWTIRPPPETAVEQTLNEDRLAAFDFEQWPLEEQMRDLLAYYSEKEGVPEAAILAGQTTLNGTLYRLVLRTPEIFADLREEATLEKCTIAYLERIDREITVIWRRFAYYIKTGIPLGPTPNEGWLEDENGAPNVVWCADALMYRIQKINQELEQRGDVGPAARDRAFSLLLRILSDVEEFDIDVATIGYQAFQRRTGSPIRGRMNERNLFVRLLGPQAPGHFIIDTLWRLSDVGGRFLNQLDNLKDDLSEHQTCQGYIENLSALIQRIRTLPMQRRRRVNMSVPPV